MDSNYKLNNIVFGDIVFYFLGRKYVSICKMKILVVNLIDNVISDFNYYKSLF